MKHIKIVALLAIAGTLTLATATGAFTTLDATRTATVQTVGDESALLALNPDDDTDAAYIGGDGMLRIEYADAMLETSMTMNDLFTITNNGENDVVVWIEVQYEDGYGDILTFDGENSETGDQASLANLDNSLELSPGDEIEVDVTINTGGLGDDDEETPLIDSIVIHAEKPDDV